jgi:hypothetical protein
MQFLCHTDRIRKNKTDSQHESAALQSQEKIFLPNPVRPFRYKSASTDPYPMRMYGERKEITVSESSAPSYSLNLNTTEQMTQIKKRR